MRRRWWRAVRIGGVIEHLLDHIGDEQLKFNAADLHVLEVGHLNDFDHFQSGASVHHGHGEEDHCSAEFVASSGAPIVLIVGSANGDPVHDVAGASGGVLPQNQRWQLLPRWGVLPQK